MIYINMYVSPFVRMFLLYVVKKWIRSCKIAFYFPSETYKIPRLTRSCFCFCSSVFHDFHSLRWAEAISLSWVKIMLRKALGTTRFFFSRNKIECLNKSGWSSSCWRLFFWWHWPHSILLSNVIFSVATYSLNRIWNDFLFSADEDFLSLRSSSFSCKFQLLRLLILLAKMRLRKWRCCASERAAAWLILVNIIG